MNKPANKPQLIDTHCHLDFSEFDDDRDLIIELAEEAGISDIIIPAVSKSGWRNTIDTCANYAQCHLALGLHPVFIEQHQPQHLIELDQLIESSPAIAVGEIGLDYYLKELDRDKQRAFFSKQLLIAQKHNLPVIVHNRKAHDDCIAMLTDIGVQSGIIHAFNGSLQQAEKYVDLGFLLGFGGMLTYPRSRKLRGLVEDLPLESIVLETDAPDMTVQQHRGERNSPHYLPFVLQAVADIKNLPAKDIASLLYQNVHKLWPELSMSHRA